MKSTVWLVVLLLAVLAAWGFSGVADPGPGAATAASADPGPEADKYGRPDDVELRRRLSPLQYKVTQQEGTERAFNNAYWDNKQPGIYVDIVSGEPLFSSTDKYKSGTGWPSFTHPIREGVLTKRRDRKLFYLRTELRSRYADSHLGHIFDDGPAPAGLRYCINSASLRFVPKDTLQADGYGEFLALFEK